MSKLHLGQSVDTGTSQACNTDKDIVFLDTEQRIKQEKYFTSNKCLKFSIAEACNVEFSLDRDYVESLSSSAAKKPEIPYNIWKKHCKKNIYIKAKMLIDEYKSIWNNREEIKSKYGYITFAIRCACVVLLKTDINTAYRTCDLNIMSEDVKQFIIDGYNLRTRLSFSIKELNIKEEERLRDMDKFYYQTSILQRYFTMLVFHFLKCSLEYEKKKKKKTRKYSDEESLSNKRIESLEKMVQSMEFIYHTSNIIRQDINNRESDRWRRTEAANSGQNKESLEIIFMMEKMPHILSSTHPDLFKPEDKLVEYEYKTFVKLLHEMIRKDVYYFGHSMFMMNKSLDCAITTSLSDEEKEKILFTVAIMEIGDKEIYDFFKKGKYPKLNLPIPIL